jgi:ATP-dependent protease ClpP protease subunit
MRSILFLIFLAFSTLSFSKEIVLTKDNTLVLDDSFSGKSVSQLIQQARKMDSDLQSGYPIYLFLNTPGGSIQAGLELIEALNGINRPVHTVTLFAASMGWQLAQHLGNRYILKYGVLMSHKASGSISGEFGGGFSQIDSRYGLWLRRINIMDEHTVKRTNGKKTLQQYRSEYDNELWINGQEAVDNGYADEVVTVKCGQGLDGTKNADANFMGFRLKLTLSACPIVTYPIDISLELRTNKGLMSLDQFLNEGGKFGSKCNKKPTEAVHNSYGEIVIPKKEAELCASDESLDYETLITQKDIKVQEMTKQKAPIKMHFFGE